MSIVLVGSTSGSITLQEPAIAGSTTINLPATSGTALVAPTALTVPNTTGTVMVSGNMPAFSANPSAGTTINNVTFTKVTFATEVYDTNNNYDTSLSRFTPTVAGYYQFNARISFSSNLTSVFCVLYKNGSEANRGCGGVLNSPSVSAIIYMNGSTDYVELYAYQNTGSPQTNGTGAAENYFQAVLVRAA